MRFDQFPNFQRRNFLRGQQTDNHPALEASLYRPGLIAKPQHSIRSEKSQRVPRPCPCLLRALGDFRDGKHTRRLPVLIATGRDRLSDCCEHGPQFMANLPRAQSAGREQGAAASRRQLPPKHRCCTHVRPLRRKVRIARTKTTFPAFVSNFTTTTFLTVLTPSFMQPAFSAATPAAPDTTRPDPVLSFH